MDREVQVLLVDDSDDDNYLHKRAIRKSGIPAAVSVALDGETAISLLTEKLLDESAPDLIFLDINMPRMTGWEFLDAYGALPAETRTHTIIVMLTTSSHGADKDRAENHSLVTHYIEKPLSSALVVEMVERFVRDEV